MRALEINPVSLSTLVRAGVISYLAHRYDDAIMHYRECPRVGSGFLFGPICTWRRPLKSKAASGKRCRNFETAMKLAKGNNWVLAMEAHAHAIAGDRSSARRILDRIIFATDPKCVPSYDIAATYAALGESRQMGIWLSRACTERNMKVFTLIQDPRFEPLHHCIEFMEIAERVGLAQYNSLSAARLQPIAVFSLRPNSSGPCIANPRGHEYRAPTSISVRNGCCFHLHERVRSRWPLLRDQLRESKSNHSQSRPT